MLKRLKVTREYLVIPEKSRAAILTFKTRLQARLYKKSLRESKAQINSRLEVIRRDEEGYELEREVIQ